MDNPRKTSARRVSLARSDAALSTIALAFGADPLARFCWPEAGAYLEGFPRFASALAGKALHDECAYEVADFKGVALWLPPGSEPDEQAVIEVVESTVADAKRPVFLELMLAMSARHPIEPHWYLPLIGVDPMYQNQGLGGVLLEPVLARCDAARLPAYLEATNPRNVPFYERLGFQKRDPIEVGDCPPMLPMLREPR